MLIPKEPLSTNSLLAQAGALIACFSWSLGTLYYRSIDTELSSLMFMGMQMLMGGLMLLAVGVAHGDAAHWAPNASGLTALFYLTFFSSCLAYTAYGWLSLNAAPALIGTYGYVNPAIAAFLGWQFLHEHLSGTQLVGMVIIIRRREHVDSAGRQSHRSENAGRAEDSVNQRRLTITSTLPLPPTNQEPTKLTTLTSTAVQNADQKPAMCMPGSTHATSATMPALITSRNRPRVMMVIGSVSSMAMGRTMEFTIPSSRPARIKVDGSVDEDAVDPNGRKPETQCNNAGTY